MLDFCQTLFIFLSPLLSKKTIIDIIINKNPDGLGISEKVEKTMA